MLDSDGAQNRRYLSEKCGCSQSCVLRFTVERGRYSGVTLSMRHMIHIYKILRPYLEKILEFLFENQRIVFKQDRCGRYREKFIQTF